MPRVSLVPQRKYELMRDLVPIASLNSSDLAIVVHADVPAELRSQAGFVSKT